MTLTTPDYYSRFKCIGSPCKHNCCIGWGVDIDENSAVKYLETGGKFGERLRKSMTVEDGYHTFIMNGRQCPFLNCENLCDIFINIGEDSLCNVCTEYPRFGTQYGALLEKGLGFSCEEAARIILSDTEPVSFVCSETDGEDEELEEEDRLLLEGLLRSRKTIIEILQKRSLSVGDRIAQALEYAKEVQEHINMNEPQNIPDTYSIKEIPPYEPEYKSVDAMLEFISGLEPMEDEWKEFVSDKRNRISSDETYKTGLNRLGKFEYVWEQIAVYFIYRYYLNAMYDFDALSKVKFAAVCTAMIRAMVSAYNNVSLEDIVEIVRCFSANIEHSSDNMDAVYDEIHFNPEWM